jgi:hypothetical protein
MAYLQPSSAMYRVICPTDHRTYSMQGKCAIVKSCNTPHCNPCNPACTHSACFPQKTHLVESGVAVVIIPHKVGVVWQAAGLPALDRDERRGVFTVDAAKVAQSAHGMQDTVDTKYPRHSLKHDIARYQPLLHPV